MLFMGHCHSTIATIAGYILILTFLIRTVLLPLVDGDLDQLQALSREIILRSVRILERYIVYQGTV